MRVIDPGHQYALQHLDGDGEELLTFVKREGLRYPGNIGHHAGTNIQETLRALIDRVGYLDSQIPHVANGVVIAHFRAALIALEWRAAERHGRPSTSPVPYPELLPTCSDCGHIECRGECRL
jgi:hypothetical protein